MRIDQVLGQGKPSVSFEFFPPKSDAGFQQLYKTIDELHPLHPTYVSVTYGAGGSTRAKTVELVAKIQTDLKIRSMAPHLRRPHRGRDRRDPRRAVEVGDRQRAGAARRPAAGPEHVR